MGDIIISVVIYSLVICEARFFKPPLPKLSMTKLPRIVLRTAILLIIYEVVGLAYIFWDIRQGVGPWTIDGPIYIVLVLISLISAIKVGYLMVIKRKGIKNQKLAIAMVAVPIMLVVYNSGTISHDNIRSTIIPLGFLIYIVVLYKHLRATTNILKQQED